MLEGAIVCNHKLYDGSLNILKGSMCILLLRCTHKLLCESTKYSLTTETHIELLCMTCFWMCKHCKDARQSIPCCAGPFLSQLRSWRRCLQCGSMRTFRGVATLPSPRAYCKMSFLTQDALVLHRCATTGWQLTASTNMTSLLVHAVPVPWAEHCRSSCTCLISWCKKSIAADPCTRFVITECGHTKSTFNIGSLHCHTFLQVCDCPFMRPATPDSVLLMGTQACVVVPHGCKHFSSFASSTLHSSVSCQTMTHKQ